MLRPDFWIWLAATAAIHWSIPARIRLPFLAGSCLGFLAWIQPALAAAFLAGVGLVHRALRQLGPGGSRTLAPTLITGLAVLLAAWKVLPVAWLGFSFRETAAQGLVPLGLSYLVFKLIHVVIEVRRRSLAVPELPEFLAYLFFIPMFSAGPIERLDHFRLNREESWNRDIWVQGGTRIVHGLVKKFGISEGLLYHLVQNRYVDNPDLDVSSFNPGTLWFVVTVSYLRIYLDFSGYSDLAIGTGRLLGFRLMENFNWPILAANPSDFWRRWHISLSQWCQLYIYMPSMGVLRSPYVPLFLTFLVMGAWHIVSWNRVGWAAYNTAGVVAFMTWTRWMGRPQPGSLRASIGWRCAGICLTQVFVLGSVAFFMNGEDQTLGRSLELLARMGGLHPRGFP